MALYQINKKGQFLYKGNAKECCELLGIKESMFYDYTKKGKLIFDIYKVEVLESRNKVKVELTERQQEIIREQYASGKNSKEIAYNTGILEIEVLAYINELESSVKVSREISKSDIDIDKLIEEKLNNKLKEFNVKPLETILTMKALGYKYDNSDRMFHLKDDKGIAKKTIKLANNQAHIRSFDKVKSSWSMPYCISYDEIEAIYNEITEKRGY